MTKPLLYLDVDGVLNVYPFQGTKLAGQDACPAAGLYGRFGPLLDTFEIVWATGWLGSAHQAWKYLCGLPDEPFRYIPWGEYKLPALLKDAGSRDWAFVDDDADWELRQLDWTRDMLRGLVLTPDEKVGLTDEHVQALLEYAAA